MFKTRRKREPLTPSQRHDVWEITDVDDITEEVEKTMRTLGMDTNEIERTIGHRTKEKKNGSKTK